VFARKRLRLRGFDYSSDGYYLITVCTHDRQCTLGRIDGELVVRSAVGAIVARQIEFLPERLPGVGVDVFVVMPNHVHVIIVLRDTRARQASPLRTTVAAFKSGSTREINLLRGTPGATVWQRGYRDHIVREEADLQRVREYVETNPTRWALDPENPVS
jgi:putative transposase